MIALYRFIRWYPWRCRADWQQWQGRDWHPWSREEWHRDWLGRWQRRRGQP